MTSTALDPTRYRHPSEAAYCAGCRCGDCAAARYRSAKRYRARVAATGPALVDAAATAARLRALLALGYRPRAVAAAAGLDPAAITKISTGANRRVGRSTAATIRDLTPAAIAAVIPAQIRIPAIGAARRIRALQAIGWPVAALAGPGRSTPVLDKVLANPDCQITAGVHRSIAHLYDQNAMTPGPSARTRTLAANRGWPPPLAWDDTDIDHPTAQPRQPAENHDHDRAERDQIIAHLTHHGHTAAQIADSLGCTSRTIERARARFV